MIRYLTLPFFLLAAVVQAQEAVTLKWQRARGDRAKVQLTSEMDMVVASKDERGEKEEPLLSRTEASYAQKVEKVGAGGLELRVECLKYHRTQGLNEIPVLLEGRTFVVRRAGTDVSVRADDPAPVPDEAQTLGGWESGAALLPTEAVAVGARWDLDAERVSKLCNAADLRERKSTVTARLESLTDGIATILFSGKLTGKTEEGYGAEIAIEEGRLQLDTGRSAPVSISLRGRMELEQTVEERKIDATLNEVVTKIGKVVIGTRSWTLEVRFE